MIIHGELRDQIPLKLSNVSVEEAIMAVTGVANGPDILEDLQKDNMVYPHFHYFPAKYTFLTLKTILFYVESGKLATAMRKRGYLVTTNKRDYLRRRVPKTEEKLIRNTAVFEAIMKDISEQDWIIEKTNSLDQKGVLDVKSGEHLEYNPLLNDLDTFLMDNLLTRQEVKEV